jgi:hypothetical protein
MAESHSDALVVSKGAPQTIGTLSVARQGEGHAGTGRRGYPAADGYGLN